MYEHNALGYRLGLALCLTKVRSSRARCPATALISLEILTSSNANQYQRGWWSSGRVLDFRFEMMGLNTTDPGFCRIGRQINFP